MSVTGIILAAGSSTRYGIGINKNFELLCGKRVIEYSIDAFNQNLWINEILVVAKKDEIELVEQIIKENKITKPIKIISGGNSRSQSVYQAITQCDCELVMIQDGARPFIRQSFINQCIKCLKTNKVHAVAIAVKSMDTVKITDHQNRVVSTTNRANTWLVQTPQCFIRETLVECYEKSSISEETTDDCMVLEKNGFLVQLIQGENSNIKITTKEDKVLLEKLMQENK